VRDEEARCCVAVDRSGEHGGHRQIDDGLDCGLTHGDPDGDADRRGCVAAYGFVPCGIALDAEPAQGAAHAIRFSDAGAAGGAKRHHVGGGASSTARVKDWCNMAYSQCSRPWQVR